MFKNFFIVHFYPPKEKQKNGRGVKMNYKKIHEHYRAVISTKKFTGGKIKLVYFTGGKNLLTLY
jgi:hypothetical protein